MLTLNKVSQMFLQQNGFIQEQRSMVIQDMWPSGQTTRSGLPERWDVLSQRKGRVQKAVVNQGYGVASVLSFHWLSRNSLSLAEWEEDPPSC